MYVMEGKFSATKTFAQELYWMDFSYPIPLAKPSVVYQEPVGKRSKLRDHHGMQPWHGIEIGS